VKDMYGRSALRRGCKLAEFAAAVRTDHAPELVELEPGATRWAVIEVRDPVPDIEVPCSLDVLKGFVKCLVENTLDAYIREKLRRPIKGRFWFEEPARVDPGANLSRYVEIHYQDEGPGIKPEAFPYVFLHGYSSSAVKHKGQGLAFLKAQLIACRGDIRIEPPVSGRGAHFVILFGIPAVV
jgi:signal transduction histidine kinase